MTTTAKNSIQAYGVRVLLSNHPDVRRLKRRYAPSVHGNKFWTSSWLIMDYLREEGLAKGSSVLEIGCGWGLASVYCAKNHQADVTGMDIDPEVFPYLDIHAEVNKVNIGVMESDFDGVKAPALKSYNLMIGADICFWEEMVDPLHRLIKRGLRAGVDKVLIADPGRSTFENLADKFIKSGRGHVADRSVRQPRAINGRLLVVS